MVSYYNTNTPNTTNKLSFNLNETRPVSMNGQKNVILKRMKVAAVVALMAGIANLIGVVIIFAAVQYYGDAFLYVLYLVGISVLISLPLFVYIIRQKRKFQIENKTPIVLSTIGLVLSCWEIIAAIIIGMISFSIRMG